VIIVPIGPIHQINADVLDGKLLQRVLELVFCFFFFRSRLDSVTTRNVRSIEQRHERTWRVV
jgi:hypothetical protein